MKGRFDAKGAQMGNREIGSGILPFRTSVGDWRFAYEVGRGE